MNCYLPSSDVNKFHAEIDQTSEKAKLTISKMLKDMGIPEANWTIERDKRSAAAEHIIAHCVGLKMYHDTIDGDQAASTFDMTGGVHLMDHAIQALTTLAEDCEVADLFLENYREIWKSITLYRGRQSISNLEQWIESASIQGGRVFGCYAVAARMVSGNKSSIDGAKGFSDGFGKFVVMYDDFVDFLEANEVDGSVAHLYQVGKAPKGAILDILEQALSEALTGIAASGCAYNISSIVNAKADGMLAMLVDSIPGLPGAKLWIANRAESTALVRNPAP